MVVERECRLQRLVAMFRMLDVLALALVVLYGGG
jgi:hypothetical protein